MARKNGGSLALHSEAGDPVKVVFLTDGAKGDISGKMEKEAFGAWRWSRSGKIQPTGSIAGFFAWPESVKRPGKRLKKP